MLFTTYPAYFEINTELSNLIFKFKDLNSVDWIDYDKDGDLDLFDWT